MKAEDRDLTTVAGRDLGRLFAMMDQWWQGWPFSRIARAHGISRQRATELLRWVACTAEARRGLIRKPDSGYRERANLVYEALFTLTQPLACKLTSKQRAALAWRAQGLVALDIARRMGSTCQRVNGHLVGARYRMERLMRGREPLAGGPMPEAEIAELCRFDLGTLAPEGGEG